MDKNANDLHETEVYFNNLNVEQIFRNTNHTCAMV
jgi:hypothetical protein